MDEIQNYLCVFLKHVGWLLFQMHSWVHPHREPCNEKPEWTKWSHTQPCFDSCQHCASFKSLINDISIWLALKPMCILGQLPYCLKSLCSILTVQQLQNPWRWEGFGFGCRLCWVFKKVSIDRHISPTFWPEMSVLLCFAWSRRKPNTHGAHLVLSI